MFSYAYASAVSAEYEYEYEYEYADVARARARRRSTGDDHGRPSCRPASINDARFQSEGQQIGLRFTLNPLIRESRARCPRRVEGDARSWSETEAAFRGVVTESARSGFLCSIDHEGFDRAPIRAVLRGMHASRLSTFVIDCMTNDVARAAYFWGRALRRRVLTPEAGADRYRDLATSRTEPVLMVQAVSHDSRIHLDIESDDIEAEVARLEELGAR